MPGPIFRFLLGFMVAAAAGALVYFHYFWPPLGCGDDRVVDTARKIVKERLFDGAPSDVTFHLITTVSTAKDGVRCSASAQVQMGAGKDDEYRDIEYIAFVGKDYYSQPAEKRGFIVFANFKK